MREISITEKEVKTVLAVFEELWKMPYEKLNSFLGSLTIEELQALGRKLLKWYKEDDEDGEF